MDEGHERALELLRAVVTPRGFLATTEPTANYRRVWTRAGVISGLAGWLSGDEILIEALGDTVRALASHQGAHGEIPSNLGLDDDGDVDSVSYGGTVGRVDCVPWFVIGACAYCQATGSSRLAEELEPRIERALELLRVWEFNRGDLVYVPLSGTWADEWPQHGYLLYVQLLRLWALGAWARVTGDDEAARACSGLAARLRINYWPEAEEVDSALVHSPRLYERRLEEEPAPRFFAGGFNPSGYETRFDAWSNALAVLLELANRERRQRIFDHGRELSAVGPTGLVPCFWPPIGEDDPEWRALRSTAVHGFKNEPGGYHNGGAWPVVNGWWGMALVVAEREKEARALLERIDAVNRGPEGAWDFPEYVNSLSGRPGGTRRMAWSAAGRVLLDRALAGERPRFREERPE